MTCYPTQIVRAKCAKAQKYSLSFYFSAFVSFSLAPQLHFFLFYTQVNRAQFERKWLDFTQKLKMVAKQKKNRNPVKKISGYFIDFNGFRAHSFTASVCFACVFALDCILFVLFFRIGYMPTWTNGSPNLLTSVWPMPQACMMACQQNVFLSLKRNWKIGHIYEAHTDCTLTYTYLYTVYVTSVR